MQKIIFIPGLCNDERVFKYQIEALQTKYHCKSIICNNSNTMQGLVDDVLTQAPEEFIVVGHSFGGMVAQWLAIQAPKKVSKLILIATGTCELTAELEKIFNEILNKIKDNQALQFFDSIIENTIYKDNLNIELINTIKSMQHAFPMDGLANQLAVDLEGKDATLFLHNIQSPTLLIYGKHDMFYQHERVTLKKLIPFNRYIEICNAGHMVTLEKPTAVTTSIEQWLSEIDSNN